jgi:hypothetical protein
METPQYIKSLLIPNGKQPRGRRVWSIDLETVWLPFFTSTNVMGETAIPSDALGAPLRLAYNPDGSVKFSRTGRPVTKVVKDIGDNVKMIRENFTATLQAYANGVITENPDGYQAEVGKARQAGEPIVSRDRQNLGDAIAKIREQELAEAKAQAEAKPKGKAKAKEPEPELVGATS